MKKRFRKEIGNLTFKMTRECERCAYIRSLHELIYKILSFLQTRLQVVFYVVLCQVLYQRTVWWQVQQPEMQSFAKEVFLVVHLRVAFRIRATIL